MRARCAALGVMAVVAGGFAGSVSAAPILDAYYAGSGTPRFPFAINSANPTLVETFTARTTGQLTAYGIYALPTTTGTAGPLTVALTTTVSGSPAGGTVLVQRQFNTSSVTAQGFYDFDVSSAGVNVVAGTTYALVTTTAAASPAIAIGGDSPGTYAGGVTYFGQLSNLQLASSTDLFFRTFVDAAPLSVPEPATAALFGTSLLGLGLLRRKQA